MTRAQSLRSADSARGTMRRATRTRRLLSGREPRLVAGLTAFVLLGMMTNVVQVFLVRETLHASAAWFGGLEAVTMADLACGVLACGRITTDAARAWAVAAGAAIMSLAMLAFGLAPAVLLQGAGLVACPTRARVNTEHSWRWRGSNPRPSVHH